MQQASASLETLSAVLQKQYSTDHGIQVISLQNYLFGDSRPMMLVFLIAVGFLLVIAWANVANLQLVRATGRQREIAVRVAIGAGRGRLVRQLLTESVVLSLAGALLGVLIAYAAVPVLIAFSPQSLPWVKTANIDPIVLLFAFCVSLVTGAIFGLLPALQASKPDLVESLKEGGKAATGSANILRGVLVVSEVALALILLVGAGLTLRSFLRLTNVHSGFEPDNVLTMSLGLPPSKYKEDQQQAQFFHDLLDKVGALPETEAVGLINSLPLSGRGTNGDVAVRGYVPASPADTPLSEKYVTSPGYFRAMGVPLVKGRFFNAGDVKGAPPVAIINEGMARRFWPDSDPIGKEIQFGWLNEDWQQVVGVVGDVKNDSLDGTVPLETYLPYSQAPVSDLTMVIKTKGDPLASVSMVRGEVLALDRDLPVYNVNRLSKVVSNSVSQPKSIMFILGLFAAIALILASVGIYGVISYWVSNRTREIGIRMALGATGATVLEMVAAQAFKIILAGVAIGLIGAFALTRLMSTLLFGVEATDPLTFTLIPILLVVIGLLASYLPALKATRVDPVTAIRYE
ncbi:MAG TPA: ABC transporter permease [Blastocatellia bacterium]